jgi:hypothetical protein
MLEKITKLDKVEIVGMDSIPVIQCRHATWIEEDGVVVGGKSYHRHVITPDSDISEEPADVQAMASAIFTQEVKDAYAAKMAESALGE